MCPRARSRGVSERRGARESPPPARRVREAERGRVQAYASERIRLRAECPIADDRMAQGGELRTDLPAAAGAQTELEHRRVGAPLAHAELGLRLAATPRGAHA